jgi:transcriptional regulator GlxA family with amidase domain
MTQALRAIAATLTFVAATGFALAASDAKKDEVPTGGAKTRNVAIVLYDGVEVLDFAGPSEVFASAGGFSGVPGVDAFNVYTMGATKSPVKSQGFVTVTPEYSIDDAPKPDIIVIPGGHSRSLTDDARFMTWVRKAIPESEVTLTVCSGAFVAAKAGALDGKQATTWYGAVENLKKAAPNVDVQEGRRFIDTGRIVTTAGVSAGIDGALHVVARLTGRSAADRTARYMEYHWTPEPYLAVAYSYLNPSLDANGRAMQQISLMEDENRPEEAVAAWRAYLKDNPSQPLAWYHLGMTLHSQKRYDEAADAGQKAASLSPSLKPQALYLVACARSLQGKKSDALTALEQSVAAGFNTRMYLEHDTDFDPIRSDSRFKALLAKF